MAGLVLATIEDGRWAGFSVSASHIASWTLTALGHDDRLAAALEAQHHPTALVHAAIAFARGNPAAAAAICRELDASTQEAYARLAAAEKLVDQGRRKEADEHLQQALAFYRAVGATRQIRAAEHLLLARA